jgi:hypothetical protein
LALGYKVVFPCGNFFPAFLGKLMFSRIPRKISREIGKPINIETLLVQSEKIEPQAMLGCKTRCNTFGGMIEGFLKVLNPIKIVLRQLKLGHFWKEEYYEIVRDLLNCLKPARLAVQALINKGANLPTKEGIFKFFF